MADVTVTAHIRVNKGNIKSNSPSRTFTKSLTGSDGPTPGSFDAVSTGQGTTVDLSELTTPGVFFIKNRDSTNFVELGVEVSSTFHALLRVGPGEHWGGEFAAGLTVANLRVKADTATCNVEIQDFEA